MKINKLFIAIGLMIAFGMFFELAAHADEANQETILTFSAPVQIPGHVLPAGTYMFLADEDNQNVVRIYSADEHVLYATLQTVSADKKNASSDTTVTLAKKSGEPPLLVKWFYPGEIIGHEFLYPTQQEQQIAHAAEQTIVASQTAGGFEGSN